MSAVDFGSITLELNLDTITSRYNIADGIEYAIEKGIINGIDELTEILREKIIEYMYEYGLGGSPLMDNIVVEPLSNGIYISVDSDYAMYVEYGTGIVGSENPHPKSGWIYDINSRGDGGWWYPTTDEDPNPTKYITSNGDYVAWTKGIPSRPFMYMTWLYASQSATQIIRKHIRLKLKELSRRK